MAPVPTLERPEPRSAREDNDSLIELTDPDSHGQACSGSKTMQATEQGQRTFTHNSPMAIPSWKYISLTAALSTVYLTR